MRSLLIIAHGSRRQASNDEVRVLSERINTKVNGDFDIVHCAFLELADPSIPEGIDLCVAQGANEVLVMPYFLSAGRHVAEDIPEQVNIAKQNHPDVCIHITDYLGSIDAVADLMVTQATNAITANE